MQEKLILAAKQGDEQALEELYRQYWPLVYGLRKKYFLRDLDEQDWLQEGFITFYDCLCVFERHHGASLGSFFKRAFENRIRSLIRREFAYKRQSNIGAVSFEQTVADGFEDLCEYTSYSQDPLQQILVQEVFEESKNNLSTLELEALSLCLEKPTEELSKSLFSAYNRSRRKIIDSFYTK
ncbi:sigma factor [Enterococcus eurekensis]|uniref:Sigma factor n=1 Tax=Enterococcus eurekensis TaxID=1159753 RepID=A0ABV9M4D8_9ENTE